MKNQQFLHLLTAALPTLDSAFPSTPESPRQTEDTPAAAQVLSQVAARLADNYPYHHPLYAGQMLKPPHPIARAAYAMAMALNPNNHALDGGRASSQMEIEAVAALATLFGFKQHLGHLTSSGTFANLEALWVSGQLAPAGTILASDQAHYTHSRISSVLKLPFETVASDNKGAMDLAALESRLIQAAAGDRRPVGTVVVTLGTTATGSVDPLDQVLTLRDRYGFRIHIDAAYGGYFTLASTLQPAARRAFDAISSADSLVIDPHKHGLQPYGCGCVLFRDPAIGRLYQHDSPYTYFSSANLHLGEISLECSRAGASAVALWATQQLLPMTRESTFARDLDLCRTAALDLHHRLSHDGHFIPAFLPELDIVVWAVKAATLEQSSTLAQAIFTQAAGLHLHLALTTLPIKFFPPSTWPGPTPESIPATQTVRCLRSVLMKPEHAATVPEIHRLLTLATRTALAPRTALAQTP